MNRPATSLEINQSKVPKALQDATFDLKKVCKRFGDFQALTDINLSIRKGERIAILGPSGAGKTTLINLLNCSIFPSKGKLRAFGQDITSLNSRSLRQLQNKIGTIYQQFHLINNLRVVHNVNAGNLGRWSFLKAAFSLLWPQGVDKAANVLTKVGIPEKLYERTDRLSGGQQQRVAIARLLIQDPNVVLADEPISNIDPVRGREIMNLLLHLNQKNGKTLVVCLHTIEFAFSHFERLVGLRQGSILFDAPSDEVSSEMVAALYKIEELGNGD